MSLWHWFHSIILATSITVQRVKKKRNDNAGSFQTYLSYLICRQFINRSLFPRQRYREALRRYQTWTFNLLNASRLSRLGTIGVAFDKKHRGLSHVVSPFFSPFLPNSFLVFFHILNYILESIRTVKEFWKPLQGSGECIAVPHCLSKESNIRWTVNSPSETW